MATLTSSDVGSGDGVTVETIFDRRIDFHPARKHYSAVSNACSNGFFLETLNPSTGNQKLQRESAFGGENVNGTPVKRMDAGIEFFEHGLDQELGFRITFRRIGAGLANLGNTCFLNSVLQCLTYTEPFAAYLQSGKHKSSCRTAGFCALCALQNHVMSALQSTGKIVSPFHLVKNLRCISRNFRNSRQEDAHEYMVNLLESMHKCCLPSGIPSESPTAYEKSLVHKIFGGRLRSQVKCMQCQYSSNKYDPFLDLSLEIAKADTVKKALANFTAVEKLDGGEKQYQCQRCKQKVRALKQLTINKPPHVLTVHLKRFSSFIPGQKIDRKVQFEPFLDLKPFVSDPNEGTLKYTLYGVLVHAGWSTHSGHYYCFVRTSSGMWHSLDDNQVRQVSEKTVLAQKAYMLFYVRDRAPLVKKENNVANLSGIKMNPIQTSQLKLNGMNNSIIQKSENMKVLAVTTNVSKIGNGNGNGNPVPVQKPSELQTKLEGPVKVVLPVMEPNVSLKESEKCEKEIEEKKSDVISNHTNDGKDKVVTLLENKADSILTKPKDDGPKVDEESKREEIEIKIIEGPIKNQSGLAQIKIEKISHKSENKSKKLTKRSSKSTMCIGRNTLFLTTLMLRKSKKFKRAKIRRLVTKQGDDVAVSEPQESTSVSNESEFVKKEDKSHKKKRGKKSREKKNGVDDVAKVDSDLLETKKNDDVAKEEVSCKRESISLLLSGLTEIKVPGWDEVPRVETSNIEPSKKNNIGYVLDEWDEEYDRGRRKKVKKSREEIEGPNPFQEMEDMKTRKKMKKLGHFGSGNQPMRI